MASIKVKWAGAHDDVEIKGYGISWRLSGDTIWSTEEFIETNETYGEYIFDSPVEGNIYQFRVRSQDTSDNWSLNYTSINAFFINNGNLPTAPSYLNLTSTPNSVIANWAGAYDAVNIKGYELSWKESSGSTYTIEPFIETKSDNYSYEITGLTPLNEYDVEVRVQNVFDEYSSSSDKVSIATISAYTYVISSDYKEDSDEDKCDISYPSIEVYSSVLRDEFSVGDKIYESSDFSLVFKGSDRWFRLGNQGYSLNTYKINDDGEIMEYVKCNPYRFQYSASSESLDYNLYTVEDVCAELSFSGNTVYANKDISVLGFGDYLYLRPDYSVPVYGIGNIWRIDDYGVQITNKGMILEIAPCPILP